MRGIVPYSSHGKRSFDLLLALAAAPLSAVVISVAAGVIKFSDGGSIFYKSERLGRNGQPFVMWKLRTMVENAPDVRNFDGSTLASPNDPRVTRVGRFFRRTSIDELPQLINVLRGEMSIVGPRPDLAEQMQYYDDFSILKLQVKPGITGLNQAYYRNSVSWEERIANDVLYAERVSFALDCRILVRTVFTLLTPAGRAMVHQDERVDSR